MEMMTVMMRARQGEAGSWSHHRVITDSATTPGIERDHEDDDDSEEGASLEQLRMADWRP